MVATRLVKDQIRVLKVESVTFCFNSTNVLYLVRILSPNFKAFVANDVGETQRNTNPDQWRHIPKELDPAELPSGGFSACQLSQCQMWPEEPTFLKKDESIWPEKVPSTLAKNNLEIARGGITF